MCLKRFLDDLLTKQLAVLSVCGLLGSFHYKLRQGYLIGTARKMSVDIDATPDLLVLVSRSLLLIMQYQYGSLSQIKNIHLHQLCNLNF